MQPIAMADSLTYEVDNPPGLFLNSGLACSVNFDSLVPLLLLSLGFCRAASFYAVNLHSLWQAFHSNNLIYFTAA